MPGQRGHGEDQLLSTLYHYYRANGLPLRNRIFGRIADLSKIGSRFAPISNLIASSRPGRWLMDRFLGIDNRRPLPRFASETFTDWFKSRRRAVETPRGLVVLFNDTFVTYNTPEIGRAAVELLEAAGYRVELVDKKCCGRPLISKGMLTEAKEHAGWNVARLKPWIERGAAIPQGSNHPVCSPCEMSRWNCSGAMTRRRWPNRASCSKSFS